ncbi:MAG: 50S ribosomal protein L24 [Coriobacteriales bacterium]|nr:50S ribosomal protein L24 [Coriobacteriales bacterium]
MPKLHVRKGDTVKVLSGKDAGATGEVLRALPQQGRVVVKGVAIVKKSVRPSQNNPRGGIIQKEAPIAAARVQLICPECKKPTRVNHKVTEAGKKVRVCKKCGHEF